MSTKMFGHPSMERKLVVKANQIIFTINRNQQNRRGNGLEAPGLYKIKGPYVATEKGHSLIKDYLRRNPVNFTNI